MKGEGKIYQHPRSRFLWMRYFHNGRLYRGSTEETDPKKAAKKLKDKIAEIRMDKAGKLDFVPNSQLRVRDLLDSLEADYKLRQARSLPQIESHLKPLREILGGRRAQDVSSDTVDKYIGVRLGEKKANGTINRETTLLGRAYRLAIRLKKLRTAPMIRRLSEEGTRREGFFETSEFQAVLLYLPDYLKGFAHFGYLSGWRKSEVRSLQWTLVDMLGRTIRLQPKNSKNKQGRVLVLAGELWSLIESQRKIREYENADGTIGISAYVFHKAGRPIGDPRKAWATACEKAGIKKLFHDLRRTRARDMRRAGVPEDICMMILGHRTRSIFTRYDIVDEKDQQEALLRTQKYLEAVSKQQQQRQSVIPIQQEAVGRIS